MINGFHLLVSAPLFLIKATAVVVVVAVVEVEVDFDGQNRKK